MQAVACAGCAGVDCVLLVVGGFERRLASGGTAGYAAPNEPQALGVALMDFDDATPGIFDNLIVTRLFPY